MATKKTSTAALATTGNTALSPIASAAMSAAKKYTAQALLVQVRDAPSLDVAANMLVQLKAAQKQVDAARVELLRPAQETVKKLQALFKPTLDELEKVERELKGKVAAYRTELENKAEAERVELLRKAEEAQAKGKAKQATAFAEKSLAVQGFTNTTMASAGGSLQVSKPWDFEVEDVGAVPKEYLTVDEAKVRSAIKAGIRDIPGVRIFQRTQLAVRQ